MGLETAKGGRNSTDAGEASRVASNSLARSATITVVGQDGAEMFEGITPKDWLTIIPAYLGTLTGTISLALVLRDRKRQQSDRSPSLELSFDQQILDTIWLMSATISNPGVEAIAFDALTIVSPPGLELVDIRAAVNLIGAHTAAGSIRLVVPKQELIRTGETRRWECYLRRPSDADVPKSIEVEAEIRVLSSRERRRRIRRTRQITN